jgi:hypothetical protein
VAWIALPDFLDVETAHETNADCNTVGKLLLSQLKTQIVSLQKKCLGGALVKRSVGKTSFFSVWLLQFPHIPQGIFRRK